MGSFFGSVQIHSGDRERAMQAAEQVARERGQKCLVGPAIGGWIGIYPEDGGQDESFGQAVAALVGGDVLHLTVHDDGVTAYWWWREGKLLDSYWSTPGYFGEQDRKSEEERRGQPELLAQLAGGRTDELRRVLARGERKVFESERLRDLSAVLGISNALTSYEYLKAGERHGISGWRQFVETPRDEVARAQQAGRVRRQQINASLKRLKADGLLLLREAGKFLHAQAARAGDGFLVAYHGVGAPPSKLELYGPPWQAGTDPSVATPAPAMSVAADRNGDRVAMALGKSFAVWNVTGWQKVVEVPEEDWGYRVALSPDGTLVACGGRERTLVVEVDGGRNLATLSGHPAQLAFHPSSRWLVAATQAGLRVTDLSRDSPSERLLFVSGRYQEPSWFADMRAQAWRHLQSECGATDKAQSTFQAMFDQIQTMTTRANRQATAEQLATLREAAEKRAKDLVARIEQGPPVQPARGNESPVMIGFSADGRWLWCGTDHGLRVYAWDKVRAAKGEDMPEPAFPFEPASAAEAFEPPKAHVYAAAEEPGGNSLLFGGINGRLHRMDLGSGQVRDLLAMPEEEPILDLVLSRDAKALGIVSSLRLRGDQGRRDDRSFWSVWSYERLRAGAGG